MFYSPPFLSLKTPFVMSNPEMAGIGLLNFLHLILLFLNLAPWLDLVMSRESHKGSGL